MSPRFHPLEVTHVRKTIRDAVEVTLRPRAGDFTFQPGQYLTFRRDFDGVEIRRSYSICAAAGTALQVGIKRVEGGAFSTWANTDLAPGMVLDAMAPAGQFGVPVADTGRHYLAFAGGSGITPILSILRTTLAAEPDSCFTLVYANRSVSTIMFRDEIDDLKNRHMGRLNVIHVLEHDGQEIDLFHGRVDGAKCDALFSHWIDANSVDVAFICGPEPMMLAIRDSLRGHGLHDDQIRIELFQGSQPGRLPQRAQAAAQEGAAHVALSITLDGVARQVDLPRGSTVLQAGRDAGLDVPFACTAGVCSTCKCRVTQGEVEMAANHALEEYEIAAGYVLSCQSYAVSDRVSVDYDQ